MTQVRVYRKDAKSAIAQGEEPTYEGKVLEFSVSQRNYGEELHAVGIVQAPDGTVDSVPLMRLQVVVPTGAPKKTPTAPAKAASSKK